MIQKIETKSLLRKHRRVESWFLTTAGFNLYRGCGHNCAYCDGRAEKYQVSGEFGVDIGVKINAPELLKRELDPARKRTPWRPGYLGLGGGVGDCYQPLEEKYQITRQVLKIAVKFGMPVHILTKSGLVERDFDILEKINAKNKVILSMSFSTMEDDIAEKIEPLAALPSRRLQVLARAKSRGFAIGMYLMPVIPYITDSPKMIEDCIHQAKAIGIDFIMFGGMTLKAGRQKDYFMQILSRSFGKLTAKYNKLYQDSVWGNAASGYYAKLNNVFFQLSRKYKISVRIPPYLYKDLLWENDLIMVMLEHLEYLSQLAGKPSSYRMAVRSIENLDCLVSSLQGSLRQLRGVGAVTEKIVQDILSTGTSGYLESLLTAA